jgi:hypothetical protein
MLITAAVGIVTIPVKYDPDNLEARFTLADDKNNRFEVLAYGSDTYEYVRNLERTGEKAFVAGVGKSTYLSGKKVFVFELIASIVVPAFMVDRKTTEIFVQQMLVNRVLSMVENWKAA